MLCQHDIRPQVGRLPTRYDIVGADPEKSATESTDVREISVKPVNYDLSLFNIEYGGQWRYDGQVTISAVVLEAVQEITLNALKLEIKSALLRYPGQDSTTTPLAVVNIAKDEQLRLIFPRKISIGEVKLTILFTGTIDNSMNGFYRAQYDPPFEASPRAIRQGEKSYMLVTHFEPCQARRAFPCFDEPQLKATFDVKIEVRPEHDVLSNMPVALIKGNDGNAYKQVIFQQTPSMSTYLVCWAIGEFECVERPTDRKHNGRQIPVRVYTARGLSKYAKFALNHASAVLDYFADVLGVDYPLPKCDNLVVPEFISGAMENWGLVVYRTTKILFDDETCDNRLKHKAAYVIAHELAHQWFGNLVTMDWWNELWLNEGFATWAGYLAVEHLQPDWQIRHYFTANVMEEAMSVDALRASSRPVVVSVENFENAEQMFDDISYFKGASLIRMISDYVGQEIFLKGLSVYLQDHSYRTATSAELFEILGRLANRDVVSMMREWIHKPGFPTVEVEQGVVRQSRFIATGDVLPKENKTIWWLPITDSTLRSDTGATTYIDSRSTRLIKEDAASVVLNARQSGFYQVAYSSDQIDAILECQSSLSTDAKIGMIRDLTASATAGIKASSELLAFLTAINDGGDFFVLSAKLKCLDLLESVFHDNDTIARGLQSLKRKIATDNKIVMPWNEKRTSFLQTEYDRLCLSLLLGSGHETVRNEVDRQFLQWMSNGVALNPSFQSVILSRGVAKGGDAAYRSVLKAYFDATSVDGKEICLAALGRVKEPMLVEQLLDLIISGEVPLQNAHIAFLALGSNHVSNHHMWSYLKQNWDIVYSSLSRNHTVLQWCIEMGLSHFSDLETGNDILSFFEQKDVSIIRKSVMVATECIKRNARFKKGSEYEIVEWMVASGYASRDH